MGISSDGIPLGYFLNDMDPRQPRWEKLSYTGGLHLVTVGMTGVGKNTSQIFPTLMEYDTSAVIMDPKGENLAVTRRARLEMGQAIYVLNPLGQLQRELTARGFPRAHRYNPFSTMQAPRIATSRALALPSRFKLGRGREIHFIARCARLAEALIFNQSHDPHWSDSARNLVNCLNMHVCIEPNEERSLGRVRELLTGDPAKFKEVLATMATSPYRPLRQKVGQFLESSREVQSILGTARTQTAFLDDPAISECLSGNDFSFSMLRYRKISVFIILHPDYINSEYVRWLRMILTSALSELMEVN